MKLLEANEGRHQGGLKNSCTTSEEKATRVQEIKDELEKKHCSKYNGCLYRLWAEMVFAGVHTDKEEPPQVPMFGSQRKRTRTAFITRELTYPPTLIRCHGRNASCAVGDFA